MRISLPPRAHALAVSAVLAGVLFALALPSGARAAEACPNEQLRQESNLNPTTGVRYSAELPDCRAYEMVSPVEKGQGSITPYGNPGQESFHQASSEGQGMMFSTDGPLLGNPSGPLFSQHVASRSATGWSTVPIDAAQLLVETEGSQVDEFLYFSPTLSCGFDETREALTALPTGESVGEVQNLYLWDAATGSSRLVTDTDPLNRLNLETVHSTKFFLYGASSDCSHVVFATEYQLLAGAPALALYEWNEGTLNLISSLPDGTVVPVKKSGSANEEGSRVGDFEEAGPSVAFTAVGDTSTGNSGEIDSGKEEVFVREGDVRTVEASRSQTATPDGGATFQMGFGEGSPEGFQVLFTSNYGLTATSSKGLTSCSATKGCDLYDYNVVAKTLTDLSVDSNVSDTEGADVFGVFGAGAGSEGSYVYFSATGQLVPGKGNTEAANNSAKEANIYVAHAGHIEYIAKIPQGTTGFGNLSGQRTDLVTSDNYSEKYSARVTPSGKSLLFGDEGNEIAAVTDSGYNNDDAKGEAQDEFYLYSAQANSTVCVSCDPSGAQPLDFDSAIGQTLTTEYGFNNGYAERNLSESGERIFFDSPDEMTPQAVVAGASINAYEWEREGIDASCPVEEHPAGSGGCIFLLASGGEVLDGTPNGDDVFVISRVPLVAQDLDGLEDVYDARVEGGFPAPTAASCTGEECQGALNGSLTFPSAGSTGSPAVGNASAQPESKQVTEVKKAKVPTRAQKLASALKVCRKKPKGKRSACESQARERYGAKVKAKAKKKKAKGKGSSGKGGK